MNALNATLAAPVPQLDISAEAVGAAAVEAYLNMPLGSELLDRLPDPNPPRKLQPSEAPSFVSTPTHGELLVPWSEDFPDNTFRAVSLLAGYCVVNGLETLAESTQHANQPSGVVARTDWLEGWCRFARGAQFLMRHPEALEIPELRSLEPSQLTGLVTRGAVLVRTLDRPLEFIADPVPRLWAINRLPDDAQSAAMDRLQVVCPDPHAERLMNTLHTLGFPHRPLPPGSLVDTTIRDFQRRDLSEGLAHLAYVDQGRGSSAAAILLSAAQPQKRPRSRQASRATIPQGKPKRQSTSPQCSKRDSAN